MKDFLWPSSTYFAEGLPWSLLHQVAAEFFTALGAPPSAIGRTSLLHGPMLLKAAFSPVVEATLSLRSWMVATQAAMGVVLGGIALIAESLMQKGEGADTSFMWAGLVFVGVLSAVHDIACDGYYMEVFDERRQARFSGLRVAAFRFAMLVGSSILVFWAGRWGWFWGFGSGAALLLLLAAVHHFALPRPRPNQRAKGETSSLSFRGAYLSFFRQESVWVVVGFLLFYKMADVLMFSMSKVLLGRDLGIGTELRGLIGFFSVGASIIGAIAGGAWVARKGLARSLFPITLSMALTEPLFALLASLAPQLSLERNGSSATLDTLQVGSDYFVLSLVVLVVIIEQLCGGLATAAQVVFIMRRCDPAHKTTHYAFATVVYSVAHIALGTASGFLFEAFGAASYFWAVSGAAIPAVLLSLVVPKEQRRSYSGDR